MKNRNQRVIGCLWMASSVALCAAAYGQTEGTYAMYCQTAGYSAPEPIGDRPGHAIQTFDYTCTNVGGLGDGAMTTARDVWEWDNGNVKVLASSGVDRKPGAVNVWTDLEQKVNVIKDADGKVTGFTGTGRGRVVMASGTTAPFTGKTYVYNWKTTGFHQFAISWRFE